MSKDTDCKHEHCLALSKYRTSVSNRSVKCWLLPYKQKCSLLLPLFRKGETNEAEGASRPACLPRSPTSQTPITRGRGGQTAMAAQPGLLRLPQLSQAAGGAQGKEAGSSPISPSVRPSARRRRQRPGTCERSGTLRAEGGAKPALGSQPRTARPGASAAEGPGRSCRGHLRPGPGAPGGTWGHRLCRDTQGIPVRGGDTRAACLLSPSFLGHSSAAPLSAKLRLSPPPEALAAPGRLKPPASTARAPEAAGDLHADLSLVVATARQA